ncbi:4-hydroxythreonine-4-phosphate dehydrogenase [Desulfarculus baarsii DSM 2075]|uniref:4-hydroxythreonine-4-phosphate dehydrogenase n=1 Tax=Desulfarculus baarsii (strain ATCC 33931 / DSM 2075 / LMG 7858 / VKM B-1802 / 2st14) TaxID=644282 RepID=E1QKJ2_DESB2|nr:4-hydroxythreonine-4-phosphate dehydrogenase PdxA [Desulfarculus baarsii]ADK86085.1 4-hydroxythreonine-4-phosphate dehydrogenase [Desulfarculus baarsii DSM 2075]
MKPRVAVTLGDPAGVGPEVVARACWDEDVLAAAELVVVGQRRFLERAAEACGLKPPSVTVLEVGSAAAVPLGGPSAAGGRLAGAFIEMATEMCQSGAAAAMATAPISKEALQAAGYPETGHTTLLGRLTGVPRPVMMLAGERLRVVLVTIHCALADVPRLLTTQAIVETAIVTDAALRELLGLARPRLAVAALNPHAGEGGMFGDEERRVIAPAVEALRAMGVEASGPHPPDTVFWRAMHDQFDVVVCMYHDQGLIPLKLLHFYDGVNVTLGLPIIRASVDHGTAYDLAGTGRASAASMKQAILWAARMAKAKARTAKGQII